MQTLVAVLSDSLRALAATGSSENANRMAARAYSALRHEHPELAQQINALMHGLCRAPDQTKE